MEERLLTAEFGDIRLMSDWNMHDALSGGNTNDILFNTTDTLYSIILLLLIKEISIDRQRHIVILLATAMTYCISLNALLNIELAQYASIIMGASSLARCLANTRDSQHDGHKECMQAY